MLHFLLVFLTKKVDFDENFNEAIDNLIYEEGNKIKLAHMHLERLFKIKKKKNPEKVVTESDISDYVDKLELNQRDIDLQILYGDYWNFVRKAERFGIDPREIVEGFSGYEKRIRQMKAF